MALILVLIALLIVLITAYMLWRESRLPSL